MKRKLLIFLVAVVLLLGVAGSVVWIKFYRERPQPRWITSDPREDFVYGSVGVEKTDGLPFWVWLVLPRIFSEYLPGPGGYASLGLPWEEGREMPVGLSKKTVGYVRVAGNCALCHTVSERAEIDDVPLVFPARAAHVEKAERLLTFFTRCAQDPRFNASEILAEVNKATQLSCVDRLIYRFVLIPRTQRVLLAGGPVVIGPSLQRHSQVAGANARWPEDRMTTLAEWLKQFKGPVYPLQVNGALAESGKAVFLQYCSSCHSADGTNKQRTGTLIPISEVGIDLSVGAKVDGYFARPLDGLWLRGPYLHNGSVPTVRDLLEVPAQRRQTFYRGNDLLDDRNLGFSSTTAQDMGRQFELYQTTQSGHSNAGHLYGTSLPAPEKEALLEYLKTL